MQPAMIENMTRVIGAPENWDPSQHGRCQGLPVRLEMRDGIAFMVSAWTPSPDELEALRRGATVHLAISAPAHPVVSMGVGPIPNVGELTGMTYAKAGVTPGWDKVEVWDEAKGAPVRRGVVEVDTIGGWAVCYCYDAAGQPIMDGTDPRLERVLGRYAIRWAS